MLLAFPMVLIPLILVERIKIIKAKGKALAVWTWRKVHHGQDEA